MVSPFAGRRMTRKAANRKTPAMFKGVKPSQDDALSASKTLTPKKRGRNLEWSFAPPEGIEAQSFAQMVRRNLKKVDGTVFATAVADDLLWVRCVDGQGHPLANTTKAQRLALAAEVHDTVALVAMDVEDGHMRLPRFKGVVVAETA
jgi:hypothetical protein